MKFLITGNLGYIGPVLVAHLRSVFPGAVIAGFDTGYFAHCLTDTPLPEVDLDEQYFGDVRAFPPERLAGVDAVINLAAISNDPMGKSFEAVTGEINHLAGVELAKRAKAAGVKSFVFASSCSVYGAGSDAARDESAAVAPLTAYARSKVGAEDSLRGLAAEDFKVTCLRFATACGFSPRLRLDLVLNDFVASAITVGEIKILSDGSPWRPLIHVKDMARAMEWAATRRTGEDHLIVNAGSDEWNFQIRDLAAAVADRMSGVRVSINRDAAPDKRSYKVDFSLFRELAPRHQPQVGVGEATDGLRAGLERWGFQDREFRQSSLIRLVTLERLKRAGLLDDSLRWRSRHPGS